MTTNETVQNEFVASAYFGVEIALERSQATVIDRLKALPVVIDRKVDLRNLNFKNEHDQALFKKNLGLALMSTYFVEILGLDGHLAGPDSQIDTAALLKRLGSKKTLDLDQPGSAKMCEEQLQSVVGEYILNSTRQRHPLSVIADDDR